MAKKPNPIIESDDVKNIKAVENSVYNISSTLSDIVGSAREFTKAFTTSDTAFKSLASKITATITSFDKLGQETSKFVEKIKQGTATQAEFNKLQLKLKDESAKINVSYKNSIKLLKDLSNSNADITKKAGQIQAINDANVDLLSTQADITQKLRDLNAASSPIIRQGIAQQIVNLRQKEKELKTTISIVENLQDINIESKKLDKLYNKIGTSFDKLMARSKDIRKILDTVSKIPILKNVIDLEKLGKTLEGAKKDSNLFKEAFKGVTGQIGAMLKTPLGKFLFYVKIFEITLAFYKKLAKAILEQDKAITQLGRNIGISKDEAIGLYDNFAKYARESNKAYLTSIDLVNANNDLNELLGSSAAFSAETLDNYVTFTKAIGLSKESFVGLNLLSFKTGQSFESAEKSVIRTVNRQILQGKVTANYRKVIEQVGKVSANMAMSFGNMTGKIAEGILLAKQFGATLEQTARIGETLLDFQSSIESELQAELLTGKRINLERARAAYLYNDQITFLKEINREIGTYRDFQNMNQIQRAMYAKSFGMQKEEFAEMLKMAELEKQYSGISKETAVKQLEIITKRGGKVDETILKNIKERALQEQILDLTTKIKQTFIDIAAGPIGTLLKGLVSVLEKVNSISRAVGGMFGDSDMGKKAAAVLMAVPLIVPGILALKGMFGFFTRGTFSNPMVTTSIGGGDGGGGGAIDDLVTTGRVGKRGRGFYNPSTGKTVKKAALDRYGRMYGKKLARAKMLKGLAKKVPYLGAALMGLDYMEEMGAGRSAGEAALGTLDQNKFALGGAGIGAGIGAFFGGVGAIPGAAIGYGVGSLADMVAPRAFSKDIPVEDFVIKPLKKDTIVAAGGTNLGRTDEMVLLLQQLVGTVKAGNKIDINSKSLVTYQNMGGVVSTAIA
jgi:hypothetical protein